MQNNSLLFNDRLDNNDAHTQTQIIRCDGDGDTIQKHYYHLF